MIAVAFLRGSAWIEMERTDKTICLAISRILARERVD